MDTKKKFQHSIESESDKEINGEDNKNIDNEKKYKTEIDKNQMLQKRVDWLMRQLPIEVRPSGIDDKDNITDNNIYITWITRSRNKV